MQFEQSRISGLIYKDRLEVVLNDERHLLRQEFQTWISLLNEQKEPINMLSEFDGTQQEIDNVSINKYMLQLQDAAADLRIRAKASAINKKGSSSYIFSQVELYEMKYKIAKGEIVNAYLESLLENEAIEFGTSIGVEMTLNQFKELIIYMFEASEATYQSFLLMIERCRTKIQTLIENKQWEKVDQAFVCIQSFNDANEAQNLMTYILNL